MNHKIYLHNSALHKLAVTLDLGVRRRYNVLKPTFANEIGDTR
jgi:hypothetical protein